MSVVIQTNRTVDLNQQPIRKTELPNVFVKGNNLAHEFNISVKKDGAEESLAAGSCMALFVNASRQTVLLSGSVSSNVATVTLSSACYAVAGKFYLVINATVGGVTQAVFYGVGAIAPGETDVVIDPDDIVPSLAELLAMVDDMEELEGDIEAAETLRVTAENGRVSAESSRVSAESTRASAESGRVSAESSRASAESGRVSAESARVSAESSRASAETSRAGAESARVTAEGNRVSAENGRVSAESGRVTAEGTRVTAEGNRVTAENARASAETSRAGAESGRVTAEGLRVTAEEGRVTAEGLRVTAEGNRVTAEGNRVTAENGRVSAENARVSAESLRETNTAQAISDCEDATEDAEGAIAAAASAASLVDSAIVELTGGGYIAGGLVQAQDTPDQTVYIPYHSIITPNGVRYQIVAVSALAATAADGSNPRIDIVYDSAEGVPTYLAGTAAASPTQPATPEGGTLSAIIARATGDNTIAAGDITDARVFVNAFQESGTVNVRYFGAAGNGIADDTEAIKAAINATEVGQTLYFPFGTYDTDEPIHITKEIDVKMDGIINYTGSGDIAVLQIDDSDDDDIFSGRRLCLRVQRETVSDWTDEAAIGIKLVNCQNCDITIFETRANTIGAQLLSDDHGFAYNTVHLIWIDSNKIGLDCNAINSGWCNENVFDGGRFMVGSSVHPTLDRFGVRIGSTDDSAWNDNDIFYKPCFEIGSGGSGEAIPVWCHAAAGCRFYDCRVEGCGPTAMREDYEGGNYIHVTSWDGGGISAYYPAVDNSGIDENALSSVAFSERWETLKQDRKFKIFDTGALAKRATHFGTSENMHIPGMMAIRWSDGSFQRADAGDVYDDYVFCDSVFGVIVNTTDAKRFLIARDKYDYGSAVCVRPMDADMNTLDGSGATRYVKWTYYYLGWQASPQLYSMGSEYNEDFFFEVTDDVKYAFIGVHRKTRSFAIYADKQAAAFSLYDTPESPNVTDEVPAYGTFELGRRLVNTDPTASIAAWLCTDAGTANTINTTATADGSAVIVVASAAGTLLGRYITVNGSDRRKILKVDGTSITLDDTVAAGSGLAVVNYEPTWTEEANAAITYDKLVFDSGPLYKKAAFYGQPAWSGHDQMHVPGMCFWDVSTPQMLKVYWGYIYHNYIRNSDGFIGVYVDTQVAKDFILYREFPLGDSGSAICVLCFDADMELMDGTGLSLITSEANTLTYASWCCGYTGSDNTLDYDLHVDASVKYIYIGMARYANLVSAKIYSDVSTCGFSTFDAQGDPHVAIGPPDAGTHRVGERTTQDVPASGSPKGWLCTVAGTNTPLSTTCTADDSAVVVVASATGLDKGQYISINSGAAKRIVKVDGTSITMDSAVAAGSGLSFENVASTWISEGNL